MVKRKGKSWDGNFHKPAHRTFPYEMRRARLFHTLKISPLFPPREIRLPRSIEFHFVRNERNSGYSKTSVSIEQPDSIRFSQGKRKKLISIEISAEFRHLWKARLFFFFLWNNFLTYINIELTEYKIFLFFFSPLHVKFRSSCSINSRVWNSCFLG